MLARNYLFIVNTQTPHTKFVLNFLLMLKIFVLTTWQEKSIALYIKQKLLKNNIVLSNKEWSD